MRKLTPIVFCAVIVCLLAAAGPEEARAGWTEVPALVNVQPGVTPVPTDQEIADMIAEANKLLKQAKIKMTFDKNKSINRDFKTPGHTSGADNKIDAGTPTTDDEDTKLDPACVDELKKHTGEAGKGVKIVISNEIHGDPATLGLAAHNPDSPVIYVKWKQTAVKGGNTTAHEFGHVFTLGKNHVVDDKGTSSTADDEKADGDGHASKPGNLMHATENGTKLTEEQIEELQKGVKGHGQQITWLDRGWRWLKRQFNSQVAAPTILSSGLALGSETPDPTTLAISTSFGGGLAPGDSMSIAMGIDTDNNTATGRDIERPDGTFMAGVDRTVMINVTGNPELGGMLDAELLDELGNPIQGLAAEFESILKFEDKEAPEIDNTYTAYDQVRVEMNPLDLGVTDPNCPLEFFTIDPLSAGGALDASEPMVVDLMSPLEPDPLVILGAPEAQPGDFVTIEGHGFFANATDILIQFDDADAGMIPGADPGGMFNGDFQVPPDAENGMYFITASTMDPLLGEQMQFGFQMLEVVPEPGTMALLAIGAVGLLRKKR